jgi:hypothetical protein
MKALEAAGERVVGADRWLSSGSAALWDRIGDIRRIKPSDNHG